MNIRMKINFHLAVIFSLISYIVALFVIPVCHELEVFYAESNCSVCNEVGTPSGNVNISELCTLGSLCHTPNHHHHNHPIHNDHCQICLTIQHNSGMGQIPKAIDSFPDVIVTAFHCPETDLHFNSVIVTQNEIRGPPSLSI